MSVSHKCEFYSYICSLRNIINSVFFFHFTFYNYYWTPKESYGENRSNWLFFQMKLWIVTYHQFCIVLHHDCHNKLCTNMYANCTGYNFTHFSKKVSFKKYYYYYKFLERVLESTGIVKIIIDIFLVCHRSFCVQLVHKLRDFQIVWKWKQFTSQFFS